MTVLAEQLPLATGMRPELGQSGHSLANTCRSAIHWLPAVPPAPTFDEGLENIIEMKSGQSLVILLINVPMSMRPLMNTVLPLAYSCHYYRL